jgi:hypothetical protein
MYHEIWESVREAERMDILEQWLLLQNGNRFPKDLGPAIWQYIEEKLPQSGLAAVYAVKYHDAQDLVPALLQTTDAFSFLLVLLDITD